MSALKTELFPVVFFKAGFHIKSYVCFGEVNCIWKFGLYIGLTGVAYA